MLVMERARQLGVLQAKVEQMREQRAALQEREKEFLQQKQFVKLVSEEQVQPVPGWFLGYLGNTLPEELFLTHFRLNLERDQWHLELGGSLQPTTNQAPAAVFTAAVATLKKNLSQGPFHVRLLGEGDRSSAAAAGASQAGRPAASGEHQFFVEGVMETKFTTNGHE